MKKPSNRRSFIQKMAALSSGFLLASKAGMSLGSNNNSDLNFMEEPAARNIKPLGFQWETRDPFLFCVHHEDAYPKGNDEMGPDASLEGRDIGQDFMIKDGWRMYHGEKVPGFPGHPHRGFETITIVRQGMVDHTDSLGASGRYGNGDVQWMTAGKGVQHAEMFPLIKKEEENPLELFQIWINLPKKNKMVNPYFRMMWSETIPTYTYTDGQGKKSMIEVIVGKIGEHQAPAPPPDSWAADKNNEVAIWNIQMEPEASYTLPKAETMVNRTLYFFQGEELTVADQKVPNYHSIEVDADRTVTLKNGSEKGYLLILQGKPIDEPVVQHGPFVMNTKAEIKEAFDDYQKTRFGGWPWDVDGPVHDKSKGRFAIHADGKEEVKGQ